MIKRLIFLSYFDKGQLTKNPNDLKAYTHRVSALTLSITLALMLEMNWFQLYHSHQVSVLASTLVS